MNKYIGNIPRWNKDSHYKWDTLYWYIKEWRFFPRYIKDFFQRGWNGHSQRDCWNFAFYNAKMNIRALSHLRDRAYGYPMDMDDWTDYDPDRMTIWKSILTAMIDGFEAVADIDEKPWELEYSHLSIDDYLDIIRDRKEEFQKLEEELYETFKFGMSLYTEYYLALWD